MHCYEKFLKTVRLIVEKRINRLEHKDSELSQTAKEFAKSVFIMLEKDEVKSEVSNAFNRLPDDLQKALEAELKFFNQKYRNNNNLDDRAAKDAETVKSSLEEVLDLPGWLKKILKVLNELLSLI